MIDLHADDFGMFEKESERILDCSSRGGLTGISIMPTGKDFQRTMDRLISEDSKLLNNLTIHINLMEGHCCSKQETVSHLVDEKGYFNLSFGKLVFISYIPWMRKCIYKQVKEEIKAQINKSKQYFGTNKLQLDSHYHVHMVPVVFDALMEVIQEQKLQVSYIRMPVERISLYIGILHRLKDFKYINLIKVGVLNALYYRNSWKHRRMLMQYEKKIFVGVMCSGRMIYDNIIEIWPRIQEKTRKDNVNVEILFHPGGIKELDDLKELTRSDSKVFFAERYRAKEAEALIKLEKMGRGKIYEG